MRKKKRTTHPVQLPAEYSLDELTRYIYRHFSHLLTDEELAAERVRTGCAKQFLSPNPDGNISLKFWRVPEVQAKYPDLVRRIDERGFASVMRAAAERVLCDNPEKRILHTCAKCGMLCRTPTAQKCFVCGFDWHPKASE